MTVITMSRNELTRLRVLIVPRLAASPRHAAGGRSATCSKSAEPDPVATVANRHRTNSTALSLGSDSLQPTRRRKGWPYGPPPPAAAGLTAPRPPQPVPPSH